MERVRDAIVASGVTVDVIDVGKRQQRMQRRIDRCGARDEVARDSGMIPK